MARSFHFHPIPILEPYFLDFCWYEIGRMGTHTGGAKSRKHDRRDRRILLLLMECSFSVGPFMAQRATKRPRPKRTTHSPRKKRGGADQTAALTARKENLGASGVGTHTQPEERERERKRKKGVTRGDAPILSASLLRIVVGSPITWPHRHSFFFLSCYCCLFCRRASAHCWRTLGRRGKQYHAHTATGKREREREKKRRQQHCQNQGDNGGDGGGGSSGDEKAGGETNGSGSQGNCSSSHCQKDSS